MNTKELITFFQIQNQIFGTCPNTGNVFRLSACHLYTKNRPKPDWLKKIETKQNQIEKIFEKLNERENIIREKSRDIGRKQANKIIKRIDKIFRPLKLNPDDSKVIFHPIDYVVFDGMKSKDLKRIIFIDMKKRIGFDKQLQQSIKKIIEKEKNYEWITLRVNDNGKITKE